MAVVLFSAATEANACWIPPPPTPPAIEVGETEQAFAVRLAEWKRHQEEVELRKAAEQLKRDIRHESALWEASQIVVVEVVAAGFVKPQGSRDRWAGMPQVTLRVTQVVKGLAIRRRPFKLRYEDAQWCLMGPAAEVVRGQVGEKFVVFAKSDELGMETVIGGYGVRTARDNRARHLLGLPEIPSISLEMVRRRMGRWARTMASIARTESG